MKAKQILTSPVTTVVLFVLAVTLLLGTTIGGARAAFMARTEDSYTARLQTSEIGIELYENGKLVKGTLAPEESKDYTLAVANGGEIDAYLRVTIYKYWEKGTDSKKQYDLKSKYIELSLLENDWILDEEASTDERTVLYYPDPVPPHSDPIPFAKGLKINPKVNSILQPNPEDKTITYAYDEASYMIEVKADAVQTHSAEKAIKSVWGVDKGTMNIN